VPQPSAAAAAPLGAAVLAGGGQRDRPGVPGPRGQDARKHSLSELEDATRLVEKIAALGGEPTTDVAPINFTADPGEAIERLIADEGETLEALQAAIEPTGREAASEAVEHRLEHMIMRKQEQVDYLLRAQRRP
jgi:bacterioferritin (cytochrome b1)